MVIDRYRTPQRLTVKDRCDIRIQPEIIEPHLVPIKAHGQPGEATGAEEPLLMMQNVRRNRSAVHPPTSLHFKDVDLLLPDQEEVALEVSRFCESISRPEFRDVAITGRSQRGSHKMDASSRRFAQHKQQLVALRTPHRPPVQRSARQVVVDFTWTAIGSILPQHQSSIHRQTGNAGAMEFAERQ